MISVVSLERSRGNAVPISTERICMRHMTIEPNKKTAILFSLEENIVTNIKVYRALVRVLVALLYLRSQIGRSRGSFERIPTSNPSFICHA